MIQIRLTTILLIAASTGFAGSTPESISEQVAITMDSVVAEALSRNPELNYYRAEIAAAKGERRTAGTIANPEFAGQAGAKHAEDPQTGATGTGLAVSASIAQTIEYPGRIALRKAIADHQITLAELGYAQFRATLAAETRGAAYALVVAEQNQVAATEVANRFRALSAVLNQREPAGVGPALEVSIVDAQTASAERNGNEAKLRSSKALLKLNQLRGRSLSARAKVSAADLFFRAPESREKLLALALDHSFELRLRQAEFAKQGLKVSLARNEKYPAFSVGPFYSHEQSGQVGEKQDIAGLSISVPLPFWNRNAGNIVTAEARQQQAEASFEASRREIERKVVENAVIYESKIDELSQGESNVLKKLRESAASADEYFRSGAIPLTTYVEIQKQYLENLHGVLDAKADTLAAAQELEILTGLTFYEIRPGKGKERRKP